MRGAHHRRRHLQKPTIALTGIDAIELFGLLVFGLVTRRRRSGRRSRHLNEMTSLRGLGLSQPGAGGDQEGEGVRGRESRFKSSVLRELLLVARKWPT